MEGKSGAAAVFALETDKDQALLQLWQVSVDLLAYLVGLGSS
jgi:hypothetical protein